MPVISSPKSLATRGRLINIEGGSSLQPALVLEANTRGKLTANADNALRNIIYIPTALTLTVKGREARTQTQKKEIRHVG